MLREHVIESSTLETPIQIQHTTPNTASAAAVDFLLDHVGNQLVVGDPLLMVSAVRAVWVIPVYLSYIHTGPLNSVGVVAVDEETGQVVAWTPIAQMKAASRELRKLHEPAISEQYQAFISAAKS